MDTGSYGLCPCEKKAWARKADADLVVVNAKIKHLRGSLKRREQRAYACETVAGLFHVTSQDLVVTLPDYGPGEDALAARFLERAIERGVLEEVWEVLVSDALVAQTVRVLGSLHQAHLRESASRAAQLRALQRRVSLGGEDRLVLAAAKQARDNWVAESMARQEVMVVWIREARQMQKALNMRVSSDESRVQSTAHRAVLQRLTLAVAAHRERTPQPTEADRALWAWLGVLSIPFDGDRRISLSGMVEGGYWSPETRVVEPLSEAG